MLCLLAAAVYTLQFAYLTMAFPTDDYSGLLSVTLAVQGTLGFLVWPLLVVVQPFGVDPSFGNFVLMAVPVVLLSAWPLFIQGKDDARLLQLGVIGPTQERPLTESLGGAAAEASRQTGDACTSVNHPEAGPIAGVATSTAVQAPVAQQPHPMRPETREQGGAKLLQRGKEFGTGEPL